MPRPLKRINLALREGMHVTLVVWRNVRDLRVGADTADDDEAVFVERPEGPCVGELHIDKTAPAALVAHEVRHAVDYFNYRQHTERSARLTQDCMATIEAVMDEL